MNQALDQTTTNLKSAGGHVMNTRGTFLATLSVDSRSAEERIYVVDNLTQPLLGKPAILKLGLIRFIEAVTETNSPWFGRYASLFEGLGCFDTKAIVRTKSSVEPFALPVPRRVAAARREPLRRELDRMMKLGVIEKVERPTDWCAPCVVVPKKSGDIRLCIDYTCLNRAVKREYHPLPSTDEVLSELADAKVFSKLDANSGYWQMQLSEESKDLTTFITPFGRYRCHRLPFGISSAPEIFQREMQKVLAGAEGTVCMMDDVLVHGKTEEEHDRRLEIVLDKISKAGLTLNKEKCQFNVREVLFLGHLINATGIAPDPAKVTDINKFPQPVMLSELRRFLGMVNYLGKFTPRLTECTPCLRLLLNKASDWMWTDQCQQEFEEVKRLMVQAPVLVKFDLNASVRLSTDASSFGLGAVLLQRDQDSWKPVGYASRAMLPAEKNYAQIEKEALAICWAAEKFYFYLSGREFEVETDHKPLVSVLGTKEVSKLPIRLQRFRLRMMAFSYTVTYTAGSKLVLADTLSRIPVGTKGQELGQLESAIGQGAIFDSLPISDKRLVELQLCTEEDEVGKRLLKYSRSSWPDKKTVPDMMKRFVTLKDRLTVVAGLVFMDSRIFIPTSERQAMMAKIHAGHLGETKCIARAAEIVWWPGITAEIRKTVKECAVCTEYRRVPREPLLPTPMPSGPWKKLAIDFFQWKDSQYVVIVDYFSRYIVCERMNRTTSTALMAVLQRWLFALGMPRTIVSDNGPQLTSVEFQQFLQDWDIEHIRSSPHYAQSNGEAERAVQTCKALLNKNSDLQKALCMYRDTPLANGYSPAELMFSRSLNSTGFLVSKSVDWEHVKKFEDKMDIQQTRNYNQRHRARDRCPSLFPGQQVKVTTDGDSRKGVVQECHGREVLVDVGTSVLRRNQSQVVPVAPTQAVNDVPVGTHDRRDTTADIPVGTAEPSPVGATRQSPVGATSPSPGGARVSPPTPTTDTSQVNIPVGNTAPPENPTAGGRYSTRSGRISKPPDRLDL